MMMIMMMMMMMMMMKKKKQKKKKRKEQEEQKKKKKKKSGGGSWFIKEVFPWNPRMRGGEKPPPPLRFHVSYFTRTFDSMSVFIGSVYKTMYFSMLRPLGLGYAGKRSTGPLSTAQELCLPVMCTSRCSRCRRLSHLRISL